MYSEDRMLHSISPFAEVSLPFDRLPLAGRVYYTAAVHAASPSTHLHLFRWTTCKLGGIAMDGTGDTVLRMSAHPEPLPKTSPAKFWSSIARIKFNTISRTEIPDLESGPMSTTCFPPPKSSSAFATLKKANGAARGEEGDL